MVKVFLTGGSGFIGSHLGKALSKRGFEVTLLQGDLFDFELVKDQLSRESFTHIIHLAGKSVPRECENDPAEALKVNNHGTSVLLMAAHLVCKRMPAFILASTGQVYGGSGVDQGGSVCIDENWPIRPQNSYATSKVLAETTVKAFSDLKGFPYAVLRIFNHSHKSQGASAFLPSIYSQLINSGGKTVRVGDLSLRRDFGCLDDLMSAFAYVVEAIGNKFHAEVFNVASGTSRCLADLARELAFQLGRSVDFIPDESLFRKNDPKELRGSVEKLKMLTGWAPSNLSNEQFIAKFLQDY